MKIPPIPRCSALLSLGVAGILSTPLDAITLTDLGYTYVFTDAITGDSEFTQGDPDSETHHWQVPAGADSWATDVYERPTNSTYINTSQGVATGSDYFGNLDIVSGGIRVSDTRIDVAIKMYDTILHKADGGTDNEGLKYQYGFRIGANANGNNSYLFTVDDPASQGTSWKLTKNFGYYDANGDFNSDGNGYEVDYIGDGKIEPAKTVEAMWSRINPLDSTIVEFQLDFSVLGWTKEQVLETEYFVFEANKGLQDPANYQWNKEYTEAETGTPYTTVGLKGNVYELDTLNPGRIVVTNEGPPIPEPGTVSLIALGLLASWKRQRSSK